MKKALLTLKSGAIILLIVLAAVQQGNGQTVLFTENWETSAISQTPPVGWGVDLVSGNNYIYFLQAGTFPVCSPFNGNRMVEFRSYNAQPGTSNRLKQTTPVSTLGHNYVAIDFEWHTSSNYPDLHDKVTLQWSINGTTWTTAATIQRYASNNQWEYEAVPLPAGAANQATLYIAFLFTSAYGDNCHLDLVHVTGYPAAPPAPSVTTLPPLYVGAKTAYLAGTVNANGNTTNTSFQYGPTASYGTSLSAGMITGTTALPVYAYPYPLLPGHQYHYRVAGTNLGGTSYGSDVTFTTADTLAEVFTYAPSNIGGTTTTLNGRVYPNGSMTSITFNYGLTTSYGTTVTANPSTISGDSLTTYASAALTGLTPNTTYHCRITGVNSSGTSHGLDTIFTTTSTLPPTVVTNPATAITPTGATLNGSVNPNGLLTTITFEYGLTTAYGTTATYGNLGGNSLVPVQKTISGLIPGTLYHFRVVGMSANGTSYGNDETFTTIILLPPTVTTNPSPLTGATYAFFSGTFNANGNQTDASFQYGSTTAYGSTVQAGTVTGNTPSTIQPVVYGLIPGQVYHYRAAGTNAGGTAYGSDMTITTADTLPGLSTHHATNIGLNSATLNGIVYPNGATTAISFDYGLTASYGSNILANPSSIPGDSIATWAEAVLTGLTPNTTYHCRIKGVNSVGTAYGEDTVFTTLGTIPPDVITTHATAITSNSAILNGQVNANGTPANVTFEYGLTPAYGSAVYPGMVYGNSMTPVSGSIFGLLPATVYHYRIVGTNANGTAYGSDTVFTTHSGPVPPTVTTTGCNYYCASNAVLKGNVNANGEITTVTFQYGLTPAYGNTVSYGTVNGTFSFEVSRQVFNLTPSTLYHYRIVGTNAGGTSYGNDTTFTTSDSSACQAQYTYHPDSLNPHTIHFSDHSLGNFISWEWDFGDGTPVSTIQNPTHTYLGAELSYTVCLTIHGADTSCNDTYCHTVTIIPNTNCQAYFSYLPGSAPDYIVQFTDHSTGTPVSWLWNFGDPVSGSSNTSTLQNPVHSFASPGTFNVCLSILTATSCTSTYFKAVVVHDTTTSQHIYGQVFANGSPVLTGVVNLFSVDTIPPYQPYLDISNIDSTGTYNFFSVPDGDYYINAIPVGEPGYLPTFFGDVLFWEDAPVIHLGIPGNPYDIHLVGATPMVPGNGTINGQINVPGLKSSFVEKITMLLMNANGQAISFDVVETGGSFSFASLAYGTYYLKSEMAGISSELIKVILSPENQTQSVTLTFSGNSITGIKDGTRPAASWRVFPNPVTDHISASLALNQDTHLVADVYTLAGQLIMRHEFDLPAGKQTISFPAASLPAGVYTLHLYSHDGLNIHTKIVKTQ